MVYEPPERKLKSKKRRGKLTVKHTIHEIMAYKRKGVWKDDQYNKGRWRDDPNKK